MLTTQLELDAPLGWNDSAYIELNPDVAEAVAQGIFKNGLEHYLKFGVNEPRKNGIDVAAVDLLGKNWDETDYLSSHPDVASAVALGMFSSGAMHFILRGQFEGRTASTQCKTTRICFDPWIQIEVNATGQVKPCCKRIADESWSNPDQSLGKH